LGKGKNNEKKEKVLPLKEKLKNKKGRKGQHDIKWKYKKHQTNLRKSGR